MNILSLLIKRTQYEIDTLFQDERIKEIVNSGKEEIAIVLPEYSLNKYNSNGEFIVKLLEIYNLKRMFDLKNHYANVNTNFFLYLFTESKNRNINYA